MNSWVTFMQLIRSRFITAAVLIFALAVGTSLSTSGSPVPPAQRGEEFAWRLYPSPTKNRITAISMRSPTRGYAIGRYLIEYDGEGWIISPTHPPIRNIEHLFVVSEKNIWVTQGTFTFESNLFQYNGNQWKEIQHPLANLIDAMHFLPDGKGWIGGDREIAFFDGRRWRLLPPPSPSEYVKSVFGSSAEEVWVRTTGGRLYHYSKGTWNESLTGKSVHFVWFKNMFSGFALSENELFELREGDWILHSRSDSLKRVTQLAVLPDGKLWGIGTEGLVMHYDGEQWERVSVPTQANLLDIEMLSETDGWIVGEDGVILRYSSSPLPSASGGSVRTFGFDTRPAVPSGREINDEYGVAIEDIDGDGWNDIYAVCLYEPNRLYMNRSDFFHGQQDATIPVFREEADLRGVAGQPGYIYLGVGFADIENDGDLDLYLCNLIGKNTLYLNRGSGTFRDVSGQSNRATAESERTNAVAFADVDLDGDLDMFVANEYTSNRLFINNGNGYFEDLTVLAGLASEAGGMGAMFADIDGDGDPDLCVVNWAAPNKLYRNETARLGGVRFVDVTDTAGVSGEAFTKSNAVAFADFDNDGDLDLFITNRKTSNRLYRNDGTGTFMDVTHEVIGIDSMLSYGASFADFDNDGFLDLYVANVGENVLYRNISGRLFVPSTFQFGAELGGYSTGTATGDLDNDGDVDLYVANYIDGGSTVYVNKVDDKNYLTISLNGTISNRDAIGSKVWLYEAGGAENPNALLGFREIAAGSGYASHSSRQVHFGVRGEKFYDVVAYFPASGTKKILRNIAAGQRVSISEQEGLSAVQTLFGKWFNRFVSDPETHEESAKFSLALVLVLLSSLVGRKRYHWGRTLQWGIHGGVLLLYSVNVYIFFYERFIFSTLLPLSSVPIVLIIVHLVYERVVMKRIAELERKAVRDRIAQDLHDDIASTLSSAFMYNEALRHSAKTSSQKEKMLMEKVSRLLLESSEAMTDIVWTVTPHRDTLGDLLARLRIYISDTCDIHHYDHEVTIESIDKDRIVPDTARRNIYLIFKEAMTNIVKHAKATSVRFSVSTSDEWLEISLTDNGCGLATQQSGMSDAERDFRHGHGLRNMRRRAEEIGAELVIDSQPGRGTRITLRTKMTQMRH